MRLLTREQCCPCVLCCAVPICCCLVCYMPCLQLLMCAPSLPLFSPPSCRYMLASLQEAAVAAGRPEWGHGGPHDSGNYNSHSAETGFFRSYGGSWDTGTWGQPTWHWTAGSVYLLAIRPLFLASVCLIGDWPCCSAHRLWHASTCPPCRVWPVLSGVVQRPAHPARRPAAGCCAAGADVPLPASHHA